METVTVYITISDWNVALRNKKKTRMYRFRFWNERFRHHKQFLFTRWTYDRHGHSPLGNNIIWFMSLSSQSISIKSHQKEKKKKKIEFATCSNIHQWSRASMPHSTFHVFMNISFQHFTFSKCIKLYSLETNLTFTQYGGTIVCIIWCYSIARQKGIVSTGIPYFHDVNFVRLPFYIHFFKHWYHYR